MPIVASYRCLAGAVFAGLAGLCAVAAQAAVATSVRCSLSSYQVGTDVCVVGEVVNEDGLPGYSATVRAGDVAGADSTIFVRPDYGNVGASIEVTGFAYDQYFARGYQSAIVSFVDRVTVTSGSLAPDTPVSVTLTHQVDAEVEHFEIRPGGLSSITVRDRFFSSQRMRTLTPDGETFVADDFFELSRATQGDYRHVHERSFASFVGATLVIEYTMFAELQFEVSQPAMNIPDFTYLLHGLHSLHSGHTYLSAAASDIRFVGEQGTVYDAPPAVPEPASALLALLGLAGLGLVRGAKHRAGAA